MCIKVLSTVSAIAFAAATTASAATFNLGDATNGANTSGVLVIQQVDFYNFSLSTDVDTLDISATSVLGQNLSENLAIYSSAGTLIASAAAPSTGGGQTASLSLTNVASGSYTIGFAGKNAFFTPNIADAYSTAFFGNGNYDLSLETTIAVVPLPAGALLLLTGVGALAMKRRKSRA